MGKAFVQFGETTSVWKRGVGQGFLMFAMKRMAASISAGVQSAQLPFGGIASTP